MITAVSAAALEHKDLIIKLATQFRLPVVYAYRVFVAHGGLMSYATDIIGQYKRAAGYVDRILKGEKPADLPVQMPTKYDLVINLKSAKAIGLTVPLTLLARADEVIDLAIFFAALHESAIGTKRTYRVAPHMSAFGGRADMVLCTAHVCF